MLNNKLTVSAAVPQTMPSTSPPLTINSPLFALMASQVPQSFLSDVVNLINRSPTLLKAISQNQAQIVLSSSGGEGGDAVPGGKQIHIETQTSYDDGTPSLLGASATGEEAVTPAGLFVGLLAHEEAHENDQQLGALIHNYSGYTLEQADATELLSEGKAAVQQALVQQEIQSSTAPLPNTLANTNTWFDVGGGLSGDTTVLNHLDGLISAGGPLAYGSEISYAADQFWNVPIDGQKNYLAFDTNGYATVSKNFLGLATQASQVTNFSVQGDSNGNLVGCSYSTPTQTFANACATPGSQQTTITNNAGATTGTVGVQLQPAPAPATETITGSGLVLPIAPGTTVSANGSSLDMSLGSADILTLSGTGNIVSGQAGDVLNTGNNAAITVNGGGTTVNGGSGSSTVLQNGGDYIYNGTAAIVTGGAYSNGTVNGGSGLTLDAGSNSAWTVNGGDTVVNAASSAYTVLQNGGNYAFNGIGTVLSTGTYTNGTINGGSGLTVYTGNGSSWTVNGGGAAVNAGNGYTVLQNGGGYTFNGANTVLSAGTYTNGTINGGSGLTAYTGNDSSWTVNGGGAVVNATNAYTVLQNGGNYIFNGANTVLSTGAYTNGTINGGSGLTAYTGNGSSWTVNGGGAVVNAGSGYTVLQNGGGYTFNGANTVLSAGSYTNGTINGGSGLTAYTGNDSSWTVNGGGAVVNATNAYTVLQNGGNYTFNGANTVLSAGAYTNGTINGGSGLTAYTGNNSSWAIDGGGAVVNAGSNAYTNVQSGTGYTLNGGTTVYGLGANSGGTINGSDANIGMGSGAHWQVNGGNDTLTLGTNDQVTISGTSQDIATDTFNVTSGSAVTVNDLTAGVSRIVQAAPGAHGQVGTTTYYSGLNASGSVTGQATTYSDGRTVMPTSTGSITTFSDGTKTVQAFSNHGFTVSNYSNDGRLVEQTVARNETDGALAESVTFYDVRNAEPWSSVTRNYSEIYSPGGGYPGGLQVTNHDGSSFTAASENGLGQPVDYMNLTFTAANGSSGSGSFKVAGGSLLQQFGSNLQALGGKDFTADLSLVDFTSGPSALVPFNPSAVAIAGSQAQLYTNQYDNGVSTALGQLYRAPSNISVDIVGPGQSGIPQYAAPTVGDSYPMS